MINNEIISQIENIKKDIIETRKKVLINANSELIKLYYRIGKIISENQKYGSDFINKLSFTLKIDFPDSIGFSPRNLSRMKRFYEAYKEYVNLPPAVAKLSWTHNSILVDRIKDNNVRIWYANNCIESGWSKIMLNHQIDLKLYERQADNSKKLTNFELNLSTYQKDLATNIMKDPYIFELEGLNDRVKEIDIERKMIERIKNVLLELGKGFSFVGNQYRISTKEKDYFIDLLFYNIKLKSYIVLEIKNEDFEPSFVGQLQFYVTAIDETIKEKEDNRTIGLLLCKNKDKKSVEWSLKSTIAPIGVASYLIEECLPTEEDFNLYLK